MNLLIAILSDTFDRVQSSSKGYDYVEKINLIIEEEYFFKSSSSTAWEDQKIDRKYLHIVTYSALDEIEGSD